MKPWPTKRLCDLAEVKAGFAWKSACFSENPEAGPPIIRIQNLGSNDNAVLAYYTGEVEPGYWVDKDDLLVSLSGSFKVCRWQGPKALLNQRIVVIRPRQELNRDFAFFQISERLQEISNAAVGMAVANASMGTVRDMEVAVPALKEQERVVRLLDEADELRNLRAQADHRTAALIPALFHEMFGGQKCRLVRVSELASLITSGSTPRGGDEIYVSKGPYFIRSQNVQMNHLDLSEAVCLPRKVHDQMTRTKVENGDILLNITGASIGRVAWVEKLDREANVSQHVCLIRPNPAKLSYAYLSVFISLPKTQHFILQIQAGASRQALNHRQVRALEIPLPPLPLQKEFTNRVAEIRALQAEQDASRHRLDDLFNSMLHRAFAEEL